MTDIVPSLGGAYGIGLATSTDDDRTLDTWFLRPERTDGGGRAGTGPAPAPDLEAALGAGAAGAVGRDAVRGVHVRAVATTIADLQAPPLDTSDVYLRLHLLSHRLVAPNTVNLDGIFGLLPTVAWTQLGPVAVEDLPAAQLRGRAAGTPLLVHSLDKFPRMLDYVAPPGVRVADANRVRLGAHLADGTTVMHEGYVNFNAGTLGQAMVEGRLSQGVVMGAGSDLGGGASVMGTLSGGGTVVVRIGERCLVGANGGIGISLGDDCVVEAGLYVTAGTRVTLPDGTVVKAKELSGRSNLLFLRNSTTGVVEVRDRAGGTVELNAALHGVELTRQVRSREDAGERMATDERPPGEGLASDALADLSRKLDTIAGALAAVAGSHTDLLAHVAEAEARRSHDAREVAQRLSALERQLLELPTQAPPPPSDPLDPFPVLSVTADLEQLRSDVTLTLEVLAQVADAVERLDHHDAATPGDAQLTALNEAVASLRDEGPAPVREKLAELTAELVALRATLEATDVAGPLADVADDLGGRIALHTDVALAGALRVIDDRLVALRQALTAAAGVTPANVGGFEAGAVMGTVQAAWTRLEQRLDSEFDDLGRQLQAMAALMEHTATIAEAVANRPVVTGDQLRRAANAVKDSVASAGRSRRDRRGGPRGIGSGPDAAP